MSILQKQNGKCIIFITILNPKEKKAVWNIDKCRIGGIKMKATLFLEFRDGAIEPYKINKEYDSERANRKVM